MSNMRVILCIAVAGMLLWAFQTTAGEDFDKKIDLYLSTIFSQYSHSKTPQNDGSSLKRPNTDWRKMPLYPSQLNLTAFADIKSEDPKVRVIIKYQKDAEIKSVPGLEIRSKIANFATAEIQLSKLPGIANQDEISFIELAKPVKPQLDVSADKIQAPLARTDFELTGAGVIVGIIDSGIDFRHADFRNANGTTRIRYMWDQNSTAGTRPFVDGTYYDGSEWTEAQINSTIAGNNTVTEKDVIGHGTHVAGIAAGNGLAFGGTYKGIAPAADLLIVKLKDNTPRGDYIRACDDCDILDALKWVGWKASDALILEPWVANLSTGSDWGPRNGTSNFEQCINEIPNATGFGEGRVIVVAAGNEGWEDGYGNEKDRLHAGEDGNGTPTEKWFTVNSSNFSKWQEEEINIEIWYPGNQNYHIKVEGPLSYEDDYVGYGFYGPNEGTPGDYEVEPAYPEGAVKITNQVKNMEHNFTNGLITIKIWEIMNHTVPLARGDWKIILSEGSFRWDAYIVSAHVEGGAFFAAQDYDREYTIGEPGNAENVITVGSFNSNDYWGEGWPIDEISYFSSLGPKRPGGMSFSSSKPELFAPGAWIASAYSRDFTDAKANYKVGNNQYYYMQGTSQAAPHVTGAAALVLEQYKDHEWEMSFSNIKKDLVNGADWMDSERKLNVRGALLLHEDPTTGIEDAVEVQGPDVINQNSNVDFEGLFDDQPLTGDYIIENGWHWHLYAYCSDCDQGIFELSSGITSGIPTIQSPYTEWNCYVPNLGTEHQWTWNASGYVSAFVELNAKDNDGDWHTDRKDVGVNMAPAAPALIKAIPGNISGNQQVTLSWINGGGATQTQIHYGSTSGVYNGTGLTEGNSPITITGVSTKLLHGLTNGPYYFALKAVNVLGTSTYSNEIGPLKFFSGTISQNTIWSGIMCLKGNVTVNSNATLTILPGTKIYFCGTYSIVINAGAKIIAEGTDNARILFSLAANTSVTYWNYLQLLGGNNSIKWCIFEKGLYPLYVYNCTASEGTANLIENCIFRNNDSMGLRIYGSVANVKSCVMYNNKTHGIQCQYNPDVKFTGNHIYGNKSYGIYTLSSNFLDFYGTVIEDNTGYGLYSANADHIHIGKPYDFYGYNTIRENGNTEVYAYSGKPSVELNYSSIHDNASDPGYEVYNYSGNNKIYAQNCFWGSDGCKYSPLNSITLDNPQSSIPDWDGDIFANSPLVKAIASEGIDLIDDPSLSDKEKVKLLKDILSKNSKSVEEQEALIELYSIIRADYIANKLGEKESFFSYLNGIKNKNADNEIGILAFRYMIIWKILENDNKTVVKLSKEALKLMSGEDRKWVLVDLAFTYTHTGQLKEAMNVLRELEKAGADADVLAAIKNDIADVKWQIAEGLWNPDEKEILMESATLISDANGLSQNYPNPGNPSTAIDFELHEPGHITLAIYNVMGQIVKSLVDEYRPTGVYTIEWNGTNDQGMNMASGIYFYTLKTGTKIVTKKLMLIR